MVMMLLHWGCHTVTVVQIRKWILSGDTIINQWNSYCLDYNFNNGNIYTHSCHSGDNQRFFIGG